MRGSDKRVVVFSHREVLEALQDAHNERFVKAGIKTGEIYLEFQRDGVVKVTQEP